MSSVELFRVDPTDPSNRGYVVVNEVLYRNAGMRTADVWTPIFNPGGDIVDVGLTEAQTGLVYVLHFSGGEDRVSHSIDNGGSWTTVGIGSATNHLVNMRVGQHNPNVVYVKVEGNVRKSIDSGNMWTFIQGPSVVPYFWRGMELPYVGNTNENELFVIRGDFAPFIWQTLTGGAPFAGYSNWGDYGEFYLSKVDGNLAWAISGSSIQKSTDKGLTATQYAAPISMAAASLYRDSMWYICGSSGSFVYTSPTFTTGSFTGRQGNLLDPSVWGASPSCRAIEPDPF